MASIQNLASGVLASDISSYATSLGVNCGEGSSSTLTAVWPSVPFYITVMPAYPTLGVANSLNSEIMLVSALSASNNVVTMTVSRGQRGTTAKAFSEGAIITNGIYTADMDYAQAVGRSFFSATLTNSITGSYTVSDSMLPNTPEDGMSIRVVFGGIREDPTATPKLRLNSGSYYNIYAGNNLRSDAGDTTTPAMVKSGVIYELTYYNGAWYVLNLVAGSSIVADNIDWATLIDKIYPVGAIYTTVAQTTAAQVKTALGGVGTWVAWGSGRVPVGVNTSDSSFNAVEKTGGSKYIQDHTHDIRWGGRNESRVLMSHDAGSTSAFDLTGWQSVDANSTDTYPINLMAGKIHDTSANFGLMTIGDAGNLQPYITCYMWKRTA